MNSNLAGAGPELALYDIQKHRVYLTAASYIDVRMYVHMRMRPCVCAEELSRGFQAPAIGGVTVKACSSEFPARQGSLAPGTFHAGPTS